MESVIAKRPALYLIAALVLGVIVGTSVVDRVSAQSGPPDALAVKEQNLDAQGNIKVHEQGVADVNVTNASLNADVTFPATQTVEGDVGISDVDAATSAFVFPFSIGNGNSEEFTISPGIEASTINVASDDEVIVVFKSPISTAFNNIIMRVGGGGHNLEEFAIALTQPIEISGGIVACENEFNNCFGLISVIGD